MSSQRVAEVSGICLNKVPGIEPVRVREIVSMVSRGYFKMVNESDEWTRASGICSTNSLGTLIQKLLGKDADAVQRGLDEEEKAAFGFSCQTKDEPCFIWAWRSFCLFGRQVHHSSVTPQELVLR